MWIIFLKNENIFLIHKNCKHVYASIPSNTDREIHARFTSRYPTRMIKYVRLPFVATYPCYLTW